MPPRTDPRPRTVKGSAPRPASSTSTPRPRRAASTSPTGRLRMCGSPSKATSPSARAATGGTKRITVPARPQSTWAGPRSVPGLTCPVLAVGVDVGAHRAQRARHQRRVARAQRPAYGARAVGERRQHQRPVGQRLAARQREGRGDGAVRPGRGPVLGGGGPGVGGCVGHPRRLPTPGRTRTLSRPATWRARGGLPAWRRWPGGGPRGARPCRRVGRARPCRADRRCRRSRRAGRR